MWRVPSLICAVTAIALVVACGLPGTGLGGVAGPDGGVDANADVDLRAGDSDGGADTGADVATPPEGAEPGELGSKPVVWLRDQIVAPDAGTDAEASGWLDSSGHDAGVRALGAKPSVNWSDPMFGSHPTIKFQDSTQMTNPGLVVSKQPITVFLVGSAGVKAGLYTIFFDSMSTGAARVGIFSDPVGKLSVYTGATKAFWTSALPATSPMILIAIFDGPNSRIFASSNVGVAANTLDAASGLGGVSIGGNGGAGLRGALAEVAVWSTALSLLDVFRLNQYASLRYGVALQP